MQTPAGVAWPRVHDAGLQVRAPLKTSAGQFGLVPLHASASSQVPFAARHWVPALPGVFWQPSAASQVSTVQGLRSSQPGPGPPAQLPPAHLSAVVQASLSSHASVLFACWQPSVVSHESSVQTLESLHEMVVPRHVPDAQWSAPVQALLSLHVFVSSFVALQPRTTSQVSSVHALPSSHTVAGPGTHALFAHLSPVVHALSSSQFAVFAVFTHVPAPLHVSSVHGLVSSQLLPPVATQVPVTQWSPVVQPSLSLHVFALLFVFVHPVAGLQASSVQELPSSHTSGAPPTQALVAQVSFVVHLLPSSQAAVFAV